MAGTTNRFIYTSEMDAFIREHYRLPGGELAAKFNARFGTQQTPEQLSHARRARGLKTGRDGRFKPDHVSWNKGRRHPSHPNSKRSQFAPGTVPPNITPLYTKRINKDGYIEIKVPERDPYTGFPTRYRLKHQWLWEQAHGAIPKGHIVVFIDSDRTRCTLENLELITKRENLERNRLGLNKHPAQVRTSIKAVAKLNVATRERQEAQLG